MRQEAELESGQLERAGRVGGVFGNRTDTVHAAHDVDVVLSVGAVLAALGAALLILIHLGNAVFLDALVLNANGEATVWTWASVVAAAAVAQGAILRAVFVRAGRRMFIALALSAGFLSLDDLTVLHESVIGRVLPQLGLSDSWDSVLWPVLYLPVLGVTVLLLLVIARDSPARIRRFILAGLALLALAILLEIGSAPWSGAEENTVHTIEGGFEEAAELAGWILLAAAVLAGALRDVIVQARER